MTDSLENFVRRIANSDFDPKTVQSQARALVSPFPFTINHSKDGGGWYTKFEIGGTMGVLHITENHFGKENKIQLYPSDVDKFCENWAQHRGKVFGEGEE